MEPPFLGGWRWLTEAKPVRVMAHRLFVFQEMRSRYRLSRDRRRHFPGSNPLPDLGHVARIKERELFLLKDRLKPAVENYPAGNLR